jgi:hypothetical protein
MGLHLFNISVDTADPNPDYIPEDLSFNDQESIVEIIVEQVLGDEDAIKEYDDHDTDDHNKKERVKIDLLVHVINPSHYTYRQPNKKENFYPACDVRLESVFMEVAIPPPQI